MNMNKGRKSNTSRAGGGGGNQNNRSSPRSRASTAEGIYNNSHFLHAAAAQVGNNVRVKTKGGVIVEGIFRTFSEDFHIALEVPHRYQNAGEDKKINVDTVQDNLIIRLCDIVTIEAKDVDLEYATRDAFATDAAISSRMNGQVRGEKELQPWMEDGLNGELGVSLELDTKANGWDASEMFQKNEKEHNIVTTYKDNLEHYTVQIERKDTTDFRNQELEAERIANEIANNPKTIERLEVENGDEEAAFAAVVRNDEQSNSSSTNSNTGGSEKMTPPPASQQQQKQPYIPKQQRGATQQQGGGRPDPNQGGGKMMQKQTIYAKPMQTSAQQTQQNQPIPTVQTINAVGQGFKTMTINPPAYNQHQPPPSHYQQREDPRGNEGPQQQERKINGENNNSNNNNSKSMAPPPRANVRILNPPIPVSFSEPPPSLAPNIAKPMSMHIPPPHLQQQQGEQGPPTVHIVQQPVVLPQTVVVAHPPPMSIHAAAPQPQRPPRGTDRSMIRPMTRNDEIRQLNQFHNNFEMAPPVQLQQQPVPEMPQPSATPQNIEKPPPHVNHHITHHPTPSSTPHDQHQKHGPSTTPPQANTPQNVNSSNNSSAGSANNSNSSDPSGGDKNAPKKFTLNPQAKPFTPRNPSTPNQSRPHTPQTPGPMVQQQPQQQQIQPPPQQQLAYAGPSQLVYCLVQPQQRPTPPPALTRKTQFHQFQVTQATGQPIFNPPVPPQVMPYHPSQMQTVQSQGYPPAIRMYQHDAQQQPHLSYLVPTPPSTTPSPGQGHQQAFHPQPSPATAGPPAQAFQPQTQTQYVMLMPSNPHQFVQYQPNQPFQLVSNSLPAQPPQQAQHPQQ